MSTLSNPEKFNKRYVFARTLQRKYKLGHRRGMIMINFRAATF